MGRESVGKGTYDLCRRGRRLSLGGTSRRFRELRGFRGGEILVGDFLGRSEARWRRRRNDDERSATVTRVGHSGAEAAVWASKWRPSQHVNS